MIEAIIILLIPLVVLITIAELGKPKVLHLSIEPFLDSYEYQDFEKAGRIRKDYFAWKEEKVELPVQGYLDFSFWMLNWGSITPLTLEFQLMEGVMPEGFECYLRNKKSSIQEFPAKYKMPLKHICQKGKHINFSVVIKKVDIDAELSTPQNVKLEIKGEVKARRLLFFNAYHSAKLEYDFFIGPQLGNVWVALDPGTTGSCIAAGSPLEPDVILEKESGAEKIIPSVITFNKQLSPGNIWRGGDGSKKINPDLYKTGYEAAAEVNLEKNVVFRSIKKLLGFVDEKIIAFANGKELKLNGKLLSSLLVYDLFKSFKASIESKPSLLNDGSGKGRFNPKRAVVAVPNNFTAVKIMDMISCLKYLGQFEEVRYVTEAEAVLCYYIFNRGNLNKKPRNRRLDETIFVFDIGGATINATIADVEQVHDSADGPKYEIEIDAQIGYGIGGDTIDYCLAKTIFAYEGDYPVLKKYNPFASPGFSGEEDLANKKRVQQLMFELKKSIIDRFYHAPLVIEYKGGGNRKTIQNVTDLVESTFDPTYELDEYKVLLTKEELKGLIQNIAGEEVEVKDDSKLFQEFRENIYGEFPLFSNRFFKQYVYDPIQDAVKDVVELSEGKGGFIDTIIFSGRSCLFPLVKETVLKNTSRIKDALDPTKTINPSVIDSMGEEELKTAVVKGACLYGIHKEAILLTPQRVNSSFGIKRTQSAVKDDFQFIELISIGSPFQNGLQESMATGEEKITATFDFDGNYVNFYQVMGHDGYQILKDGHKHKYSRIASIPLHIRTKMVGAKISQNDFIECYVRTISDEEIKFHNTLADQEISDANDEHYTWMVG